MSILEFIFLVIYLAVPVTFYTCAALSSYIDGESFVDLGDGSLHAKIIFWPLFVLIWLLVRFYKVIYWLIYGGYIVIAKGVKKMVMDEINDAKNYKPYEN